MSPLIDFEWQALDHDEQGPFVDQEEQRPNDSPYKGKNAHSLQVALDEGVEPSYLSRHPRIARAVQYGFAGLVFLGVAGEEYIRHKNTPPQAQEQGQEVVLPDTEENQLAEYHPERFVGARSQPNWGGWITYLGKDTVRVTNTIRHLKVKITIPEIGRVDDNIVRAVKSLIELYPHKAAFNSSSIEINFGKSGEPVKEPATVVYDEEARGSVNSISITSQTDKPSAREVLAEIVGALGYVDGSFATPESAKHEQVELEQAVSAALNNVPYETYLRATNTRVSKSTYNTFRYLPDAEGFMINPYSESFFEQFAFNAKPDVVAKLTDIFAGVGTDGALVYTFMSSIGQLDIIGDLSPSEISRIANVDSKLFSEEMSSPYPNGWMRSARRVVIVNSGGVSMITKQRNRNGNEYTISSVSARSSSASKMVGDEMFDVIYTQAALPVAMKPARR